MDPLYFDTAVWTGALPNGSNAGSFKLGSGSRFDSLPGLSNESNSEWVTPDCRLTVINFRAAVVRCSGARVFTDAQPREREFHGGHRGSESLGGRAFELRCRGVGGLVVARLAECWPVSTDVVVAVDMKWFLMLF
jgi:hypothetical protein